MVADKEVRACPHSDASRCRLRNAAVGFQVPTRAQRRTRELGIRLFTTQNQIIKLQYGKPYNARGGNLEESTVHLRWH